MQDKIDELCRLKEDLHMLVEDVVVKVLKRDWSDIDDVSFFKNPDNGAQLVQLRVFEPMQDPMIWIFPAKINSGRCKLLVHR